MLVAVAQVKGNYGKFKSRMHSADLRSSKRRSVDDNDVADASLGIHQDSDKSCASSGSLILGHVGADASSGSRPFEAEVSASSGSLPSHLRTSAWTWNRFLLSRIVDVPALEVALKECGATSPSDLLGLGAQEAD